MSKPGHIKPQRHNGKCWHDCPPQQATGWLAIPRVAGGQSAARFTKKAAAQAHLERAARLAKPARTFSFAAACPPRLRSAVLLAASSNHKPERY